jgi:dTDP-glucose 4,6-dehydratase
MRYFVTGGAGFIGSNYVEYLLENVHDLTSLTVYDKFTYAGHLKNLEKFHNDPRLTIMRGDICDIQSLSEAMRGHNFLIHFAAESHVDKSILDAGIFVRTNVLGTFNILEAALNNSIDTVVHVSTDEVYGSIKNGAVDENAPLNPNSPYAASKASSDLLARSYFITHGLDVRITRSCNNYGKYQFPEKVIPVFVNKLLANENLPIYGDGENIREWIHVSDHVRAIQLVLKNGLAGEVYNIGTGNQLSNNTLSDKIMEIMSTAAKPKTYINDRKGHDFRYSIDSSKIESLGFKHEKHFSEGLRETITWYKSNPDWWAN